MTVRPLHLAAAFVAALTVGASSADAATFLGSQDTSATPDGFACGDCPAGVEVGFRQFALRQATVEAPEDGVVTAASVNARRIAGTEAPRVAVLRPGADGVSLAVVASAPLPLTADVSAYDDLHLPMRRGDSLGFVYRTGEVSLGIRNRPRPDGAVQSFALPCGPCGMDGGTGTELLLDAVLEPDVDADGLGDETQDPDGGGLGPNWVDDWFTDYNAGDRLDDDEDTKDFGDSRNGGDSRDDRRAGKRKPHRVPKDLRLLAVRPPRHAHLAADQRAEGRHGQRERHAAGQRQERRRTVHDDPDGLQARQARRPRPADAQRRPPPARACSPAASTSARRWSSPTSRKQSTLSLLMRSARF